MRNVLQNNRNEISSNNKNKSDNSMPKVLMFASVASMIAQFNVDNINILTNLGYKVDVAANFEFGSALSQEKIDEYRTELINNGTEVFNIPVPRSIFSSKNIINSYI